MTSVLSAFSCRLDHHMIKLCTRFEQKNRRVCGWVINDLANFVRPLFKGGDFVDMKS